jgi:aminoglycoside 6'-N-acetyltransferase
MADLGLLAGWLKAPHVSLWWNSDAPFDEEKLADPRVSRWIVSFGERPFAYMQDYSVHGWPQHPFDYLPDRSRGIDQYIGEPDMIGKGRHGVYRAAYARIVWTGGSGPGNRPEPKKQEGDLGIREAGIPDRGASQRNAMGHCPADGGMARVLGAAPRKGIPFTAGYQLLVMSPEPRRRESPRPARARSAPRR